MRIFGLFWNFFKFSLIFKKSFRDIMGIKAVEKPNLFGRPVNIIFDLVIVDRCISFDRYRLVCILKIYLLKCDILSHLPFHIKLNFRD